MSAPLRLCSIVLLGVAILGCTRSGDDAPDRTAPAPTPSAPAPTQPLQPSRTPGVEADGTVVTAVDWFEGELEAAIATAATQHKLVFVDVGAYWCPPCHRLDEEVFTDPGVGRILEDRFVAVHVDAEKGDGPRIVEQYHVQAFPTMLVLDDRGIEMGRVVDFVPPERLVEALIRIAQGDNVLSDLVDAVERDPDDLEARYRLAHAYALAARREDAVAQLDAIAVADPRDELGLASRAAYDRAFFITYKLDAAPLRAVAALEELQRRFPDSPATVRAYRAIGRMLAELGRTDEALDRLDAMLATDPEDPALAASYGWFSFRNRCRPDRGLAVVEEAIERTPQDADLRYLQAELLHLLARDDDALVAIQRAAALEPQSAYYRRQVRRFEKQVKK